MNKKPKEPICLGMGMRLSAVSLLCLSPLLPPAAEGEIVYTLAPSVHNADPAIRDQIMNSVAQGVSFYNQWGSFNKALYIVYNPSIPTADAGYNGYVQFGGSRGTRVALHEFSHTVGVGTHPQWAGNLVSGTWTGLYATGKVQEYDGAGAALNGDGIHFWPYGLNFEEENRKAHVEVVANLREDMGHHGIVEEAKPQHVSAGGTAVFSIDAPEATSYAWYKVPDTVPLADGGGISGATTDTLSIANVFPTDEGHYYCKIANLALSSRPARLAVGHQELYDRKDCTLINVRGAGASEAGNKFVTGGNPPTVRALGFIDLHNSEPTIESDGDGLLQSHRVTLWRDSDGAKIAEVTIPAGTGGRLINGFRYASILQGAVTLDANTAYVVSADITGIQDPWLNNEPWLTPSPYFIGANGTGSWQGRWGTPGTRPSSFNSTGSFYGLVNISSKELLTPLCAAPANLTVSGGNGSVTLDWDDNLEPSLFGYNVYRSSQPDGVYTLVGSDLATSSFVDASLEADGSYHYVVKAEDVNGTESQGSDAISANVAGVVLNFFRIPYPGTRNNYTGWVGYEFTPSENLKIHSLGRAVSGSINGNHDVRIWRVSDQALLASVTVGSSSPVDEVNYAYETLASSVTLDSGVSYRIASSETAGGDAWRDLGRLYGVRGVASINGGAYGTGDYPASSSGGGSEGYVPVAFYYSDPAADTEPPTPNPGAWASLPQAVSSSAISMTAVTGADASGTVEYYFDEITGNPGGTDSGWQASPSYTDDGLSPGTTYTYSVTMRDAFLNEGTPSANASATTDASEPPAIHCDDIAMGFRKRGRSYYGQALARIKDANGANIAGAAVFGSWSGAISQSAFGITDSNGTVFFESAGVRDGGTYVFTVDSVALEGYVYDASANVETSDSITAP